MVENFEGDDLLGANLLRNSFNRSRAAARKLQTEVDSKVVQEAKAEITTHRPVDPSTVGPAGITVKPQEEMTSSQTDQPANLQTDKLTSHRSDASVPVATDGSLSVGQFAPASKGGGREVDDDRSQDIRFGVRLTRRENQNLENLEHEIKRIGRLTCVARTDLIRLYCNLIEQFIEELKKAEPVAINKRPRHCDAENFARFEQKLVTIVAKAIRNSPDLE